MDSKVFMFIQKHIDLFRIYRSRGMDRDCVHTLSTTLLKLTRQIGFR